MFQSFPVQNPLVFAKSLLPGGRQAAATDLAFERERRAEEREIVFSRLSALAHRYGLHTAPSVALNGVFTVRDGRRATQKGARAALSEDRVDILLLNRAAAPILAIDYATEDMPTRLTRRRDQHRVRLFERAGLPLVILRGLRHWDDDLPQIMQHLRATTVRN